MTVWSKRKKNPAMSTHEAIEWMRKHTIGDLKQTAASIENNGGDASSVRHLLTEIDELETEILASADENMALEEVHMTPR